MNTVSKILGSATLAAAAWAAPAQASSQLVIDGSLLQLENGTTFDTWKIVMQNAGSFKVNVLAYESTSNSSADALDLNGDGEFTYLDPDTHFWLDDGSINPLQNPANHLARCDDIANNCPNVDTPDFKLTDLGAAFGASDGSIHFQRDPAYEVTLAGGNYLFVMADYRLTETEAASGLNVGDTLRNTGLGGHADYRVTFSSDNLRFSLSGNTITVSQVPLPGAVWLFGSALLGFVGVGHRKS
ncbi:VPLPA-CTERM sorting domain-containing protein [Methylomonas sp. SURF-2]|uniref:VPLPA-CTERM sorting domain-containing protein n=1 Tax=Methylomonas subterranea TaxID=2952225 RepID=A0ABT1TIW8_9GAMM|nr:VPLPA-CTERM sorting domain-containing protein [Methylomonas sp. SURF-2]MCQ8105390.1 VPLPA-CTERM sorting domain-containing protein [Methylomonas sp. SURF-2]